MASEDVIELGSSDEDPEPAPKKSKPMPNAMVCIPSKLHEVTIKPAKINKNMPPKGIVRGVSIKTTVTIKKSPKPKIVKPPLNVINPLNLQTAIKHPIQIARSKTSQRNPGPSKILKEPIKIQNSPSFTKLPPSITVKKTSQLTKRPIVIMNPPVGKKILASIPKQITVVPTVELDDDESPVNPSPVWYIRPEEEKESCTLEQQNNNEPASPKMIEITIEDSPIKALQDKRTCEVGAELAVTIQDSPAKPIAKKKGTSNGTDDERESSNKEFQSKKKLEYPKETDENKKTMVIEIDIPFLESLNLVSKSNETVESKQVSNVSDEKIPETSQKIESSKEDMQNIDITKKEGESEFHSVYQSFIDLCFKLENSEDMTKIVEKKIKGYYRQVPKEYTESEEFIDMVSSKIMAIKVCPDKMYLFIKDIVDELNMQRKIAKSQVNVTSKEVKTEEPEQILFEEDCEYDMKRQRQIRKLEKTIKKLHHAIQKLESQEVDFDDDDDSVYLLTERYKERMVRVYAKFCQLTNTKMPSEPRVQIDARPGKPTGPAKRLEKWINKKVPIGTPLPFPDFHDVIRCVRDANEEDKLHWNEADIMEEARDLFTRCGKKLQRRRQENEWRLAASRIISDVDPAENDEQLKLRLSENRKLAQTKEIEIFNKYADRQKQLQLEAEEIGDKEADESPVESEEEETVDDGVLLENKNNRKDRLKRLLQERSKRISNEKENQPSQESEVSSVVANSPQTNNKDDTVKESEADDKGKKDETNKPNSCDVTETLSVSDNSKDFESDIDELHLLQKLHSENEAGSSALESSDSDSPIAISDSYESDSEGKKDLSDVISIENSSFSESEVDKVKRIQDVEKIDYSGLENNTMDTDHPNFVIDSLSSTSVADNSQSNFAKDTECLNAGIKEKHSNTNNDENEVAVENILLASSDEENMISQEVNVAEGGCINLKDDLISIDDTVVGNVLEQTDDDVDMALESTKLKSKETISQPGLDSNYLEDDYQDTEKTTNGDDIEMDTSQDNIQSEPNDSSTQHKICVISDVQTSAVTTDTSKDLCETDNGNKNKSSVEDNVPSTASLET